MFNLEFPVKHALGRAKFNVINKNNFTNKS